MTKGQALALLHEMALYEDFYMAGHDLLNALDAAGAFEREPLPTRADLIDVADDPRTHDDDPAYIERAIDALIAAGFLKVRP